VKRDQVDWDEPSNRTHRAVNIGRELYEEITIFFRDAPDAFLDPVTTKRRFESLSLRFRAKQMSKFRVLFEIACHKLALGNDLQALFTRIL
jgi:ABC-type phosphate/phosphonate transport system ATPase subunit